MIVMNQDLSGLPLYEKKSYSKHSTIHPVISEKTNIALRPRIVRAPGTTVNVYATSTPACVQSFEVLLERLPATQSLVGGDAIKLSLAVHLPIHLSKSGLSSRQFNFRNGM